MLHYEQKRGRRADQHLAAMAARLDLNDNRLLEVSPFLGDLGIRPASDFGCEVVGIDPIEHDSWPEVQHAHLNTRFTAGDIAGPHPDLGDESFDLIVSFFVWKHIGDPWSVLSHCQRLLRPDGLKFLPANRYRSASASHLNRRLTERWRRLSYSK